MMPTQAHGPKRCLQLPFAWPCALTIGFVGGGAHGQDGAAQLAHGRNRRMHMRLYSNKQMLMHGGRLDSLAIPKAPGATAGFTATPWAAVKQEQAVKQEWVYSGQTTITNALSKAMEQTTHAPNLEK